MREILPGEKQLSRLMSNMSCSPEGGNGAIFSPFSHTAELWPLASSLRFIGNKWVTSAWPTCYNVGVGCVGSEGVGGCRIGTRSVSVNGSEGFNSGWGFSDWQSQCFNAANKRTLANVMRLFLLQTAETSFGFRRERTDIARWRLCWQRGHDLVSSRGSAPTACCKPLSF